MYGYNAEQPIAIPIYTVLPYCDKVARVVFPSCSTIVMFGVMKSNGCMYAQGIVRLFCVQEDLFLYICACTCMYLSSISVVPYSVNELLS